MARRAPIENTDYENPALRGVIDFMHLSTGGTTVQPVDREWDLSKPEEKLAYEKFMRDPVVITIHATHDKNEPLGADIYLNGVPCPLPRDVPLRVPRAYVEVLAQSQLRSYSQERVANPDATEGMKTKRHTGAQFPFQVNHDPHPKGNAWLRRVMFTSV